MTASLLIVVLHYRGLQDTLECLASLDAQDYGTMQVLVVDNASGDDIADRIRQCHPGTELLTLPENRGWSGGNNAGIRLAQERNLDFVCLLNNDTVVPPRAIGALMRTASHLGSCILHPAIDSYDPAEGAQLDPSVQAPGTMRAQAAPDQPGLYEIDTLNGACVLVACPVFTRIGLIDERYFLLCEDADLGRRARAAGFELYCDTGVRILHKESRSFGGRRTPLKTYYGVRNILLYHRTHERFRRFVPVAARDAGWTISGTAQAATGTRPRSWWSVVRWIGSADPFALATRLALRDFALGRFGRLNARDAERLRHSQSRPGARPQDGGTAALP